MDAISRRGSAEAGHACQCSPAGAQAAGALHGHRLRLDVRTGFTREGDGHIRCAQPRGGGGPARRWRTGSETPRGLPTPPRQAQNRALKTLEAAAANAEDEFEEDEEEEEEEEEEKVYTTVVATTSRRRPRPRCRSSRGESVRYRRGPQSSTSLRTRAGRATDENQDAHFLAQIDDKNAVFGVLDGHGQDHGRIAAHAAAAAYQVCSPTSSVCAPRTSAARRLSWWSASRRRTRRCSRRSSASRASSRT